MPGIFGEDSFEMPSDTSLYLMTGMWPAMEAKKNELYSKSPYAS